MNISGKYYLIEQDNRFPLSLGEAWQPFTGQHFATPTGCSIYVISGYGSLYIGSDANGKRPYFHRNDLKRNDHCNDYLQNTANKHGLSGFYYQVVAELPADTVSFRPLIENAYIRHFDTYANGYNLCEFADTPLLGQKRSKEIRENISKGRKGISFSPEHRRRLSESHKGKPCSQEALKATIKTYRFINPSGETVVITNLNKFCRENGLNNGHMVQVAKGRVKSHKQWRRAD